MHHLSRKMKRESTVFCSHGAWYSKAEGSERVEDYRRAVPAASTPPDRPHPGAGWWARESFRPCTVEWLDDPATGSGPARLTLQQPPDRIWYH